MQLAYYFENDVGGSLVIGTLQGKKLVQYELKAGNRHVFINNNRLDNGLYFYNVFSGTSVVAKGKLVIIR
ncbi:MAG: T9SS type A sorting domain-containing protein [Bacteroidia bacterium]|nr:T9SS type A sorting domain-containing protein [Bacteroidia bacterium]